MGLRQEEDIIQPMERMTSSGDRHHLAQVDHVQGKGFPLIGFLFYRSCGGSWETELYDRLPYYQGGLSSW